MIATGSYAVQYSTLLGFHPIGWLNSIVVEDLTVRVVGGVLVCVVDTRDTIN